MFKKFWNWLFKCGSPNPSAIIEPVGGIDGMIWDEAEDYAKHGYDVRRVGWKAKTWYVRYDPAYDRMEKWDSRGIIDSKYEPVDADFAGCDWIVINQ